MILWLIKYRFQSKFASLSDKNDSKINDLNQILKNKKMSFHVMAVKLNCNHYLNMILLNAH